MPHTQSRRHCHPTKETHHGHACRHMTSTNSQDVASVGFSHRKQGFGLETSEPTTHTHITKTHETTQKQQAAKQTDPSQSKHQTKTGHTNCTATHAYAYPPQHHSIRFCRQQALRDAPWYHHACEAAVACSVEEVPTPGAARPGEHVGASMVWVWPWRVKLSVAHWWPLHPDPRRLRLAHSPPHCG